MGNFFADVNSQVFSKAPGGDTFTADPLGFGLRKSEDEEEELKRIKEEKERLQSILQGKIDAMTKAREMPSLTSADTRMAGKRAKASLLNRGGRASTLLSEDALGGGLL